MLALYGLLIRFVTALLPGLSAFNSKLKRSVEGRKGLFETLRSHYSGVDTSRKRIVIHVSSFGELEQAKPIIKRLKSEHPEYHIHLTFFSASGYENAVGKYAEPDLTTYLPFDTRSKARKFIDIVRPDLFIFVRYDVWHNLADELHRNRVKMLLICATFDARKLSSGIAATLYRETYKKLDRILAIRQSDADALQRLGVDGSRLGVSGDTRFDQVVERKALTQQLPPVLPSKIVEDWRSQSRTILVVGSSWEPDEKLLLEALRDSSLREKSAIIVVPHEIGGDHVPSLVSSLGARTIKLSDIDRYAGHDTIVVDSIGKLFALYQYADIAYVGGGFGAGVHNTLEAAVWGAPVICGPKIERSKEIAELVGAGGAVVVRTPDELGRSLKSWMESPEKRLECASMAENFVNANRGAVANIMTAIYEAS